MDFEQQFCDDLRTIYIETHNLEDEAKEHIYQFTKALVFMIQNLNKERKKK